MSVAYLDSLRAELAAAGLPANESEVLVADPDAAKLWHACVTAAPSHARFALNWLVGDAVKLAETTDQSLAGSKIDATTLGGVAELVQDGQLSSTNAKQLLAHLWVHGGEPQAAASTLGLLQESNEDELAKVVDEVIAANAQAVADYKAGNARAFGALVGQAMKATKGKGNPPVINQLLIDRLG